MTTKLKRRMARQFYDGGFALFQQEKYDQALVELRKAEDIFRALDAQGHPFGYTFSNGVSGLSNTLVLEARCYQKTGGYQQAIRYYEGSLINEKFERKRHFHAFWSAVRPDVITCYEKTLENTGSAAPETLIQDPRIDLSYVFPFSLPPELVPVARLYELAPERYPHVGNFYAAAKKKDVKLRRMDKISDESTMRKLSFYVWGVLVSIWVAYGLVVVHALHQKK